MHNRAVKKGQKVQVEVDTGISKTIIDCYILEPESDRLVLSFPASQKEYIPYLSEGTEIKAFVYSFTGIMIFDSIVFDSPFNGVFVIEFSNHHQVIQRRRYLRMPFITDFFIIGKDEEDNIKNNKESTKVITSVRTAIIIVGILIYLYFVYTSYKNFKNPNKNLSKKDKKANNYALLSSILFLIASIIVFYVNLLNTNEEIDFF